MPPTREPRPTSTAERVRSWGAAVVVVLAILVVARAGWLLLRGAETPAEVARPVTASAKASRTPHPASVAPRVATTPPGRLTLEEVAMLGGLCPTALSAVPAKWLPEGVASNPSDATADRVAPPHRLTAARSATAPANNALPDDSVSTSAPRARITGLRIASRSGRAPIAVERPTSAAGLRVAQSPAQAVPQTGPRDDGWLVAPSDWFAPEDAAARLAEPATSGVVEPVEPVEPRVPSLVDDPPAIDVVR